MKEFTGIAAKTVSATPAGARQRISSLNDVAGAYSSSSHNDLQGDPIAFSPFITIGDAASGEVFITNFPYSDVEITGIVDVAKSTLRINQQEAYFHTTYNEMVYFTPIDFENGRALESVTADILEDGTIVFPENITMALKLLSYPINEGYFFGVSEIVLTPIRAWKYDAAEWEKAGSAEYFDGWMCAAFGVTPEDGMPLNKVDVMKSKTNEGEFLLVNPESNGSSEYAEMFQVQGGYAGDGYLRFNIANPDCAYIYPLVGSGGYLGEEDGSTSQMFPYNLEGIRITREGYDYQDVADEWDVNWLDMSYFDKDTNTAYFFNLMFGLGDTNMLGQFWWVANDPTMVIEGQTVIKLDFDPYAAVGEIAVDENAPVKYFNLQGVEIAQPAKGQLVIKKQGSKSVKMIAE